MRQISALRPHLHSELKRLLSDGLDDNERLHASLSVRPSGIICLSEDVVEAARTNQLLFSDLVLREVAALPSHARELNHRPRVEGTTLTIDSYESLDLDDGLSLRIESDGTRVVGISASDVSAWVRPGTGLDASARQRVSSVYGESLVAPMFPPALSDDKLSLHQGVRRLTKTLELRFDGSGKLLGHRLFRSVFINQHRLNAADAEEAKRDASRPKLKAALIELTRLAAKLEGNAESVSVKTMLERFHKLARGILAKELAENGYETSYRNQPDANSKATYGPRPLGHKAVGGAPHIQLSAIRRYADLDVHRALDRLMDGRMPVGRVKVLDHRLRMAQLERDNQPPRLARALRVFAAQQLTRPLVLRPE